MLELRRGEGVARLALVVGRVPAHPERLGNEQRGSVAPAAALGGNPGRGIRVEHIVAVERRTRDTIARRPVLEVAGEVMLVESGAEGDLIVLDDEDRRELLNRGEVRALVRRRGLGGAVAYPGEGDARLPPDLERERDSRGHRDHIAHVRDGLQHALRPGADVEVAAACRRVLAAEIGAEHVAHGQPQLAAGRGVPDHRGDHVPTALERMHGTHGRRFLPGPEPRLGDDAGAHPALQLNVVQPRAQ